LREGTRREEIRATNAELEAARATEALVEQNLGRQRRLLASGATTASAIDQTEGELARARAHRTAIQNQLSAMRSGARDQEVRAAEAQVAAARAGLASTEERLVRHTLVAPMGGTVLDVHVEPGEVVGPGTPVVTVVDPRHPFVDVFVPQGQIDRVRVDQPVHVRVDSLDESLDGRVEHISPRTEFTPRFLFSEQERPNLVIRARIRVDDPEERLRAGVPAFVSMVER
jgi:HlyD family secretion protein